MTTNDAVARRILQLMKEKNYSQYKIEQKSAVYHGAMNRILTLKNIKIKLISYLKMMHACTWSAECV